MRLQWQIAFFSPWGIVDFSQERCLLLKMWFRLAWHFPERPPPLGLFSRVEIYYWQVLGDIRSLRPIAPQQVKCNNSRIDYMWTTEQHSENVFTVVSLSSKCQESALSRRSPARWMFNESQSFYNCPHKHIFKQVDQQRVSPEALKKKVNAGKYFCRVMSVSWFISLDQLDCVLMISLAGNWEQFNYRFM